MCFRHAVIWNGCEVSFVFRAHNKSYCGLNHIDKSATASWSLCFEQFGKGFGGDFYETYYTLTSTMRGLVVCLVYICANSWNSWIFFLFFSFLNEVLSTSKNVSVFGWRRMVISKTELSQIPPWKEMGEENQSNSPASFLMVFIGNSCSFFLFFLIPQISAGHVMNSTAVAPCFILCVTGMLEIPLFTSTNLLFWTISHLTMFGQKLYLRKFDLSHKM